MTQAGTMTDATELDIIHRIRSGDINAFEFLVKKYERKLFITVGNMLKNRQQVEDLVQDVFLSAFQHIAAFRPDKGHFSTWLFRIARNKCLNEIKRKRDLLMDSLPDSAGPEDPIALLIRKETGRLLDDALYRLKFRDRMIFVLAEFNQLSYAEIAVIENINIGTVKSRLARTREKLRQLLEKMKG
jgi:RNA polymerase sigma-70 factor, ECF subfamily